MDRTVVDWRAEEKELSDKLHQKLLGLTLLYPPSDEFRNCLSDEMFLKPNQNAFFHVMHYLFRLLDPVEFKKRFYWPITDKRSESNFRAATMEYLKFLNDKHQLNWQNIKSYLVVLPGGMKFISFMLDFVGFVVQDLIKNREKQNVSTEMDPQLLQPTEVNLKRLRRQNEFFKQYASSYAQEIDKLTEKLRINLKNMKQQLEHISSITGIDVSELTSDEFQLRFEAENKKLYQEKFAERAKNIESLSEPILELKNEIDKYQTLLSEMNFNKLLGPGSLEKIQQNKQQNEIATPTADKTYRLNDVLLAFNSIYGPLHAALLEADENSYSFDFVNRELSLLFKRYDNIENQITDFQKIVNDSMIKRSNESKNSLQTPIRGDISARCRSNENSLLCKIVFTPPIKLDMSGGVSRLPLLDDIKAKSASVTVLERSVRNFSNNTTSFGDTSTIMNKTKIIDPLQLLRTISKNPTKNVSLSKQNLSRLSTKWVERQTLLTAELDPASFLTPSKSAYSNISQSEQTVIQINSTGSTGSTIIALQSPYTPLNSNDRTRVARNTLQDTNNSSLIHPKKLSAVKKVQDASINFQNLSTSPSGRLEALVTIEHTKELVRNTTNKNDEGKKIGTPTIKITEITAETMELEKSENNQNEANLKTEFVLKNFSFGEEALFNTSDSVLKDISS